MENFSAINARSFIGRNVNLHLKDGAVIINVQLTKLFKVWEKTTAKLSIHYMEIARLLGYRLRTLHGQRCLT